MSINEYDLAVDIQRYSAKTQIGKRKKESTSYLIGKRALDMVCSFAGIVLLLPVFILIGILLKLEDPKGSIFFAQIRIGKDGKAFRMYKFRSMVPNAEELLQSLIEKNDVSGAMFKMKNDPRITKVGKIIRRTSIDEFPQFWNVLKGDMSLVGPRPPLPREIREYSAYDMQRLLVKPGCTGLWQINGRSRLGFNEMVELDLEYISNRNLAVDLKIMAKTCRVLLGSKDAL
ncbi:sugar transferase [Cohnella terricola]|uniref:Sugar transferase n=1 Tax=Cohnella terricola TaxID=1289167 RepID=A0A559JMP3_9BACL|nr:sugar transferase [Cohnella terricola]TVY01128.1 sugar transferase [Cohnella terricola]